MKTRLKHRVEYVVLRGVAGLVGVLPYRAALAVGWGLAGIGFHAVRFRRREAERRIREVFGGRYTDRQVRQIAWQSLRNLLFTAVDIIRTPSTTLAFLKGVADYDEFLRQVATHHATGRGAIIAVPHMGAWELPGRAMLLSGLPLFSVAGKQRNPLFDQYLNTTRERSGIPITMRGASTLRAIITRLKAGDFLALLPDVRMRTEAVKVRFLGKEANLGAGMALFARHAGVPIYPVIVTRVGWARHAARIYPPIFPDPSLDKQADVQRMTQQVMDIITQAILADPGQWFWYNKRWVLEPVKTEGAADERT
ncbi:MAG: lysophospholipid acyltransferase family protein [bacterium]